MLDVHGYVLFSDGFVGVWVFLACLPLTTKSRLLASLDSSHASCKHFIQCLYACSADGNLLSEVHALSVTVQGFHHQTDTRHTQHCRPRTSSPLNKAEICSEPESVVSDSESSVTCKAHT